MSIDDDIYATCSDLHRVFKARIPDARFSSRWLLRRAGLEREQEFFGRVLPTGTQHRRRMHVQTPSLVHTFTSAPQIRILPGDEDVR